jgi:hypothetical protein
MHRPSPKLSPLGPKPSRLAGRVRRLVIALLSALILCLIVSQMAAEAQPIRGPGAGGAARSESQHAAGSLSAKCVALGLEPIPAKLTLFLAGDAAYHIPTLRVSWSAKPLPRRCKVHTVIAVRARVRFPKTGRSLEFGPEYSSRWRIFWLGRTNVDNASRSYPGPAVTFNLGCVEQPQGWLRYEVRTRGGRSLARLVRPIPLSSEICERRGRRWSSQRGRTRRPL